MHDLKLTGQQDPRRPNLAQLSTEDEPPGTLEDVAPGDPKDPLPADNTVESGIPVKSPSPDTTESPD